MSATQQIPEDYYKYLSDLSMQCYCEHCECKEEINYMHHDDWGRTEDYVCETCLEKCYRE